MKKAERAVRDILKTIEILKLPVSDKKKEILLKEAFKRWYNKYPEHTDWKFKLGFQFAALKNLCKAALKHPLRKK